MNEAVGRSTVSCIVWLDACCVMNWKDCGRRRSRRYRGGWRKFGVAHFRADICVMVRFRAGFFFFCCNGLSARVVMCAKFVVVITIKCKYSNVKMVGVGRLFRRDTDCITFRGCWESVSWWVRVERSESGGWGGVRGERGGQLALINNASVYAA
jgi:hypothetical protein